MSDELLELLEWLFATKNHGTGKNREGGNNGSKKTLRSLSNQNFVGVEANQMINQETKNRKGRGPEKRSSGKKVVKVADMSEAETAINKLIEKAGDSYYCNACPYKSQVVGHIKEHVETHIEGLEYSCLLCGKISQTKSSLRSHRAKCYRQQEN